MEISSIGFCLSLLFLHPMNYVNPMESYPRVLKIETSVREFSLAIEIEKTLVIWLTRVQLCLVHSLFGYSNSLCQFWLQY